MFVTRRRVAHFTESWLTYVSTYVTYVSTYVTYVSTIWYLSQKADWRMSVRSDTCHRKLIDVCQYDLILVTESWLTYVSTIWYLSLKADWRMSVRSDTCHRKLIDICHYSLISVTRGWLEHIRRKWSIYVTRNTIASVETDICRYLITAEAGWPLLLGGGMASISKNWYLLLSDWWLSVETDVTRSLVIPATRRWLHAPVSRNWHLLLETGRCLSHKVTGIC